jgi:hypothetical protein
MYVGHLFPAVYYWLFPSHSTNLTWSNGSSTWLINTTIGAECQSKFLTSICDLKAQWDDDGTFADFRMNRIGPKILVRSAEKTFFLWFLGIRTRESLAAKILRAISTRTKCRCHFYEFCISQSVQAIAWCKKMATRGCFDPSQSFESCHCVVHPDLL